MRYKYQAMVTVSLLLAASLLILPAPAQNSPLGERLILNVYLDYSGKALVTGYAENVSGLAFLSSSQYRFENDSRQLYALTDNLTAKAGDLWTLRFYASGSFGDYRVTFYLPRDMRLGEINASKGLGYLLSASNESLVADVQGYEVTDPQISIQYRQPLPAEQAGPSGPLPMPASGFLSAYPNNSAILILAAALIATGSALSIAIWRRRSEPRSKTLAEEREKGMPPGMSATGISASTEKAHDSAPVNLMAGVEDMRSSEGAFQSEPGPLDEPEEPLQIEVVESLPLGNEEEKIDLRDNDSRKSGIDVSSEMEAVMQTLTPRERAVITTLINHSGRMTQAEIRYETGTPKSSLTGILISLERRKLVTKKEWGRTNIIELSEWFLSKKERS